MDHHVSQDLSVAGTRKGLEGDRSGLFKEQIRIIKEMRKQYAETHGANEPVRPRYCIWENVKGCLSSPGKNRKGEDFRAVLTEFVRVVCEGTPDVPMPDKRQWKHAGVLYGVGDDGRPFSVAWRLHDAQYHGVPQRRSRMCVLCDYGGYSAGEILFDLHDGGSAEADYKDLLEGRAGTVEREAAEVSTEHEGLPGDLEQSEKSRKEDSGNSGADVDTAISFIERGGIEGGGKGILISKEHTGAVASYIPRVCCCIKGNVIDRSGNGDGETAPTITGDHNSRITDYTALCVGNGQLDNMRMKPIANSLDCMHDQQAIIVPDTAGALTCGAHPGGFNGQDAYNDQLIVHALKSKSNCDFREDSETYPMQNNLVRRLIPDECASLQGFPKHWCNIGDWIDSKGKKHKDSDTVKYKAFGNSIALPFWQWLAGKIQEQYDRPVEIASLFDGIGGFPLVFENAGGKAVWASEIEEFPIAVTKIRFPEE